MPPIPLSTTDLGQGIPVVVLHGLFGRKRNWQAIQKRLSENARIVTADLRNHGDSGWGNEMTYEAMAADIGDLITGLDAGPAIVIGHSMGGKAAMTLALTEPDLLKALMVIDIAPVDYSHDYTDYIAAMRAVPLAEIQRRGEAEPYIADAIKDPGIRSFLLQNLGQDERGLKWQVNLDAIERHMPDILGFPDIWAATYDGPTSFVRGGASDYVQDKYLPVIASMFPAADHEVIEGAGHWVHAEKPADVISLMSTFISENE